MGNLRTMAITRIQSSKKNGLQVSPHGYIYRLMQYQQQAQHHKQESAGESILHHNVEIMALQSLGLAQAYSQHAATLDNNGGSSIGVKRLEKKGNSSL